MLPRGSEVRTLPGCGGERHDRVRAALARERPAVKQLVAPLEPAEEKLAVSFGDPSQRVEPRAQWELARTNEAGVRWREGVHVAAIATRPLRIVLHAEPAFHLT